MTSEQLSLNTDAGTTVVTTASSIIESLASKHSTHIYLYDSATDVGLGSLSKQWSTAVHDAARVLDVQTRTGAGLSIAGRLSEGTSAPAILSAFLTPATLAYMLPSLHLLPPPTHSSRTILHVANINGSTIPDLSTLPAHFIILFSSTPQEIVDIAAYTYAPSSSHIIHVFDHESSARELRQLVYPSISGKTPAPFVFSGSKTSTDVIVTLNTSLSPALTSVHTSIDSLSILSIRTLSPFPSLSHALPHSVQTLHILSDPATSPIIHQLVLSTKLSHSPSITVLSHPSFNPKSISSPKELLAYLDHIIPNTPSTPKLQAPPQTLKKLLFFSGDSDTLPQKLIAPFLSSSAIQTRLLSSSDIISSTNLTRVLLAPKSSPTSVAPFDHLLSTSEPSSTDFIAILSPGLLKTHSQAIFAQAKPNSPILITSPYTATELISYLPLSSQLLVRSNKLRLYTISSSSPVIAHLAFLRLYLGEGAGEWLVEKVAKGIYGDSVVENGLTKEAWEGLNVVGIPPLDREGEEKAKEEAKIAREFEWGIPSSASATVEHEQEEQGSAISSWHLPALSLLFPSPTSSAITLRPEIPPTTPTYLITCTVNKRLTPSTYDRNVFHLEFDTAGTGLTYKIGEALGVWGWNDETEVREFLNWYTEGKTSEDQVVSFTLEGGKKWSRTVFQALQQNIDIFGRPPKSFYASLAPHATLRSERQILQFIASAEGSSLFKKLSEVETVNYADVLKRFKSARPKLEDLMEMVGSIKERHYSIASAQSVVGERVDLLVVTVEWVTPSGTPKYGQCTRYLADLKPGQKVTVSIKPSVMKLPPSDLQPIIMAGLGTGAAPFRAFIQHRALLHSQGVPVGPLIYYFGSRHRKAEYLYGEELEAYLQDTVITHMGLAFSRDGPKKVYIQHKMKEDGELLAKSMSEKEKGVFYLCGPTWPVPDVWEALVDSLVRFEGLERKRAEEYLEGLKEEERYVLEVY